MRSLTSTADNTDAPYDLDRDGMAFVTDRLQMAREIKAATDYFKTGVWGSEHTAGRGPGPVCHLERL